MGFGFVKPPFSVLFSLKCGHVTGRRPLEAAICERGLFRVSFAKAPSERFGSVISFFLAVSFFLAISFFKYLVHFMPLIIALKN